MWMQWTYSRVHPPLTWCSCSLRHIKLKPLCFWISLYVFFFIQLIAEVDELILLCSYSALGFFSISIARQRQEQRDMTLTVRVKKKQIEFKWNIVRYDAEAGSAAASVPTASHHCYYCYGQFRCLCCECSKQRQKKGRWQESIHYMGLIPGMMKSYLHWD